MLLGGYRVQGSLCFLLGPPGPAPDPHRFHVFGAWTSMLSWSSDLPGSRLSGLAKMLNYFLSKTVFQSGGKVPQVISTLKGWILCIALLFSSAAATRPLSCSDKPLYERLKFVIPSISCNGTGVFFHNYLVKKYDVQQMVIVFSNGVRCQPVLLPNATEGVRFSVSPRQEECNCSKLECMNCTKIGERCYKSLYLNITIEFSGNRRGQNVTSPIGNTTINPPLPSSYSKANITSPCQHSENGGRCKQKTNSTPLIGIAVGCLLLISILLLYFFYRRKGDGWLRSSKGETDSMEVLPDHTGLQPPTVFSLKELKVATKSFADSRLLGGGGFGTVYEGWLSDKRVVAVKKLNQGNKQGLQQFRNEIKILSSVKHPNLVQLLGYCLDGRDLLLVYEFVPNGTLADHLHGERGNGLSVDKRLTIALETAQALTYLHCFVDPPIYHRDVKSSNILLDKDFCVKVADFGLSRLMNTDAPHISTAPQGTPGYLDPDYHESYQLTDKSDVYSFGVVLMELISGKRAVDMSRGRKEINLASLAVTKIQSGALEELYDPNLDRNYWKVLGRIAELAFRCLAHEKDDRPCMKEVAEELQDIKFFFSLTHDNFVPLTPSKLQTDCVPAKDSTKSAVTIKQQMDQDEESPTSVQASWTSTGTSPNDSKSEP